MYVKPFSTNNFIYSSTNYYVLIFHNNHWYFILISIQ